MVEWPLNELVDESIERLEELSEAKDIKVVSEVPKDLEVWADHEQVRRVLFNLIHNAIKWSPAGETITVTSEEVSAADEVIVSVLDNGPGVPDDQTERIFERFYQVDPSRSGGEGTGLGLAICKHIVEAHGGQIWAEGNQNGTRGGIFRFTLGLVEQRNDSEKTAVVSDDLPLP
jgi:two-component system phosphate regulon sensor histidine kinase PhoR